MVHRHLPSPDFHRLDWQHYGLRAERTKKTAKNHNGRAGHFTCRVIENSQPVLLHNLLIAFLAFFCG
jgi:hypothetical protein